MQDEPKQLSEINAGHEILGLVFSREQFKTLLRMIYIANTIVNGHREENMIKEYDDLEQYIFSRAGAAGYPAATWKHEVNGEAHHHPSRVFEKDPETNIIFDAYEDALFFELLAERLAERDIDKLHGPNVKDRMSAENYDVLVGARAEEYLLHFKHEDLNCISISGME